VPAQPDSAPVPPDDLPEAEPEGAGEVQLSRSERRAAARGKGPSQKIHGPVNPRLAPPPAKARNYAARKSG